MWFATTVLAIDFFMKQVWHDPFPNAKDPFVDEHNSPSSSNSSLSSSSSSSKFIGIVLFMRLWHVPSAQKWTASAMPISSNVLIYAAAAAADRVVVRQQT